MATEMIVRLLSMCVLLFTIVVSEKRYEVPKVCTVQGNLAMCNYETSGIYSSSTLDRSIERIEIGRMTDAVFDLANLPMVTIVEILSDAFDSRTLCTLIRRNWQPVTVVLGDQKGLCPAENLKTGIPETSTDEMETISLLTKLIQTPAAVDVSTVLPKKQSIKEETALPDENTTDEGISMPSTDIMDNDIIIIIITASSVIGIMILCGLFICTIRHKCHHRCSSTRTIENIELGVRFGSMPRASVSSEETVFPCRKRD